MFTIIGGDNKPYGPSTAEEIREWLIQGRADGRTLAQQDGGVWKPLSTFPEFADLFTSPGALPKSPNTTPTPAEILARDYDLDIISCVNRAWELLKRNFWPVVGITFLVIIAAGLIEHFINLISEPAVNEMIDQRTVTFKGVSLACLTTLLAAPVQTLFIGGLFRYYLKLIRGEEAGLNDAFSGLSDAFVPLAILGVVQSFLTIAGTLLCILPGIYISVALIFAIPLLVDRRIGIGEAMTLSLKAVNKHWFMTFALLVVVGLVSVCGFCALCVGIFVTAPLGYLVLMYAYEDIFGPRAR